MQTASGLLFRRGRNIDCKYTDSEILCQRKIRTNSAIGVQRLESTMKLNERLAELRRDAGFTLRELRERIETHTGERLSVSYLSELERTDNIPPLDTLSRLAQGYDLTLGDLLAPVDFFAEPTEASYPKSLREFISRNELDPEWVAVLSRIEFRGQRPDSDSEWQAIYSMLRAFLESKAKGKGKT